MEYPKFKVTVNCMTYNQSKYITDAMNGFTMQQTSFPYVCTIVDDASTDGEQEVIHQYVEENFDFSEGSVAYHKETDYAHITYAQHKTNKNCYFAVLYLNENHYSQKKPKLEYLNEWVKGCSYTALCEGDDYWVDSNKLQKQHDILESDLSISLVVTGYYETFRDEKKVEKKWYDETVKYIDINDAITVHKLFFATASMFYRNSSYEYPSWRKKYSFGDIPLFLVLASKGNVCYMKDFTTCYRCFNPGSWSERSRSNRKRQIQLYKEMFCMWTDFDKWSNKTFHHSCMLQIKYWKKVYYHALVKYLLKVYLKIKL